MSSLLSQPSAGDQENGRGPAGSVGKSPLDQDSALEQRAGALLSEMAAAWRDGARPTAEEWLARHRELAGDPEVAVRIVYEEICQRQERGEPVNSTEIYERFPQWKDELRVVLDFHRWIDPQTPAVLPEAGARLGEFHLLRELGRGALGRVFLATQPSLSDRLLVVKLTPRSGYEHLSLARLQHTHIVPLYHVQDFPQENLRALCMPYLGGANWSALLGGLKARPPHERRGRHIVELLEATPTDAHAAASSTGPALSFLARSTYVESVAWMGSCLADALHYAHQRGLVHLDVKPSNVLLTADGQPMLLDFHLAHEVVGAGPIERLGGTRGYMSPEQERCAAAVASGRPLPVALDGRSDIYSLGVLLYESLAGRLPPPDVAASRGLLHDVNPQVSRGLADVLQKCLARDCADRYADAGQLAADLRRHLAALPLQGVPNRALERWQKWQRRKPYALPLLAVGFAALAATLVFALVVRGQRLQEARSMLAQAQKDMEARDYASAAARLEAGWSAIGWLPGQYDLKQSIKSQLAAAQRARRAGALHEFVEQLRFVDGLQDVPPSKLRAMDDGCRKIWDMRHALAEFDDRAGELETRERRDLWDLAAMWARLYVRVAPANEIDAARRHGLEVLDQAESLCGPNLMLSLARRECQGEAAWDSASELAAVAAAKTTGEHYVVGRHLFQAGELVPAQAQFEQAIQLEPNAFWPNFYLTQCTYRRERFDEALRAAQVCVALSPKSAECFYNRALCHQALGNSDESLADFARARQLDPTLAIAALGRGTLLAESGRYTEALADLKNAVAQGADPAAANYRLATVQLALKDPTAALASLQAALAHDPDYRPAVELKSRLDGQR